MGRKWLILGLLIALLCATSCKDNYYIENNLHGVWQVVSVDNYSTDVITYPQGTLYYMFQRSIVALCYKHLDIPERMERNIAHFDMVTSDSIGMGDFRAYTTGEGNLVNNEEKVSVSSLRKYGIFEDYTLFHMQLSKDKMMLTSDSACIILRKY